ncbi:hypothetical protein [Candidatus Amarobacter glycogenicus]|uniref:hypothetical protein n=1 Tax=Candidatus Amarobacter glycogenicus TaxID=3140699 RepID=UPI0031374DE2|nr:hypothetical protein [Dehalococcoidia bacterium]
METTRYFEEQVLPRRRIEELGGRWLRVVTLEDGKTIHNAFPDRGFKLDRGESK